MKAPIFGKKLLVTTLTLMPLSVFANMHAYNSCNDILAQGAYTQYRTTTDSETGIALKKWLCSTDHISNYGRNSFQSAVVDTLSLDRYNGNVDEWKRAECIGFEDSNYTGSKAAHLLIQKVNDGIIDDWSNCMQEQQGHPLVCYAKQTDQSLRMILRNYGNSDIEINNIASHNITSDYWNPRSIQAGRDRIMRYTIDDKKYDSEFVLYGETEYGDMSCNYTIPKKPNPSTRHECEVYRLNALSEEKITTRDYEYFKETNMVPLFSSRNNRYMGYYPCDMF
ncbi:hypothetical protein BS333_14000 [Vibrio azureus]|uniref:Uncharacterized protein n=1 Tax=Vibrio azureus NBRC 104587 TaxID=1219077 RepID=U3A3B6_9VIBR|nr:hypothetical protein [Vibrio azureus]AUI87528.1 hypothetical protein BS333_14000 [Vibrio azureus]GAD74496.1 hypothetical protein VAZ01S_011_00240 [Vibrio azureus NBRC 104587]